MQRKVLAGELVDFLDDNKLVPKIESRSLAKDRIERGLNNSEYVEWLIHLLITKTKYRENVDFVEFNKLVSELEKIRLELEYKWNA